MAFTKEDRIYIVETGIQLGHLNFILGIKKGTKRS